MLMFDRRRVRYNMDLLIWMTRRELMIRYRHAFFGFLWVIVNPLFQTATLGLLFRFFTNIDMENYYVFLFLGLLSWNYFSQSVLQSTSVIINNRNLLTKAAFPKELLVLAVVFAELTHFLVALGLISPLLVREFSLGGLNLVWILLATLWLTCLAIGVALFTASVTVWFRDMQFLVRGFVPLWFYATPILYTTEMLPAPFRKIIVISPLVGIMELFRHGFFADNPPSVSRLSVQLIISLVVISGGASFFKRSSPFFIDKI